MHSQTPLLEKRLKKQAKKMKAPVEIRNIVAYQLSANPKRTPTGEFDGSTVSSTYDAKKFAKESESEVVNRIIGYIVTLMEEAGKIHVQHNFIHPQTYVTPKTAYGLAYKKAQALHGSSLTDDEVQAQYEIIQSGSKAQLDPTKLNQLTLLSLHEFALYPNVDRGPLSTSGFQTLLNLIDRMAITYPENLLLLLGTVPVKTASGELHNIGIFVQCGPQVTIHTFAKAYPSLIDLSYPKTKFQSVRNTFLTPSLIEKVNNSINVIVSKFNFDPKSITLEDLRQLKLSCNSHPTIKPSKKFFDLMLKIIKNKKQNPQYLLSQPGSDDLNEALLELQTFIETNQIEKSLATTNMPAAILGENSDESIYFSGSLTVRTAGKVVFSLLPEICLDHSEKVIKTRVELDLALARQSSETLLPTQGLHVVTSNSVFLAKPNLMSTSVVQADPIHSTRLQSVETTSGTLSSSSLKQVTQPTFGPPTNLAIYPPMLLTDFTPTTKKDISSQNTFFIKLNTLRHYREQRLAELPAVNKEIVQCIVEPILTLLRKNAKQFSSEITQLENPTGNLNLEIQQLTNLIKTLNQTKIKPKLRANIETAIQTAIRLLDKEVIATQRLEDLHALATQKTRDLPKPKSTPTFFSPTVIPTSSQSALPYECKYISTDETSPVSTALPSFNETLVTVQFLSHFSPFTLPWNKITALNLSEEKELCTYLEKLNILEKSVFDKSEDVGILIKNTKAAIQDILKNHKKTSAQLSMIKDNIERIKDYIEPSGLKTKKI